MPLTTADKIGIGQIGLSGLTGLLGGMNNSADKDRATNEQRYAEARDDEFFQLLLQALGNQSNVEQDVSSENLQRSLAFANANPLGAEQDTRTKSGSHLARLDLLQGRKLGGGQTNNAAGLDLSNLRSNLSPQAVDESIRQRRIATAGLDPRAAQEIGGAGSDYASRLFGNLQQSQNQRRDNASQAYSMIGDKRSEMAAQQAQLAQTQEKDDGPGFWKKLGGTVLPIAGLTANFIPGVGPLASMAIGAASGAAGGAMLGGKKGALAGGIGGGAAAYGLNQLPSQQPQRQMNNQMTPQSQPQSMIGFENRNPGLRLQSTPNAMGMPTSPSMNAPGLRPSTLASPTVNNNQRYFGASGNNRFGMGSPQFDFSKMVSPSNSSSMVGLPSTLEANRPTAMRAPTMIESFKDSAPMQGLQTLINTLGGGAPTANPSAFQQVLATPQARLATLGMGGGFRPQAIAAPKAAPMAPIAPPSSILGGGPALMKPQPLAPPSGVMGGGAPLSQPPADLGLQKTVQQLLQAYQNHLAQGNTAYAQQTLQLMQPFLKGLK